MLYHDKLETIVFCLVYIINTINSILLLRDEQGIGNYQLRILCVEGRLKNLIIIMHFVFRVVVVYIFENVSKLHTGDSLKVPDMKILKN